MIHPTAVVMPGAIIGDRVTIEPFAVIYDGVIINHDAYIGSHAVIGSPPQEKNQYPAGDDVAGMSVVVSANAVVREHSQVQSGIVSTTFIGKRAHVMAGSHIAHDCRIGDDATISASSCLGGFTMIGDQANIGLGVVTHPWVIIGESAMVGLNSSVIRDVLPYQKVAGSPARLIGSNQHKNQDLPSEYDASLLNSECLEDWARLSEWRNSLRTDWYAR